MKKNKYLMLAFILVVLIVGAYLISDFWSEMETHLPKNPVKSLNPSYYK